jgi:3-oxoacyl-[acyl-carrier protein] reductase
MSEKLLAGKVAIVTGAGSGMGRASSILLAQAGARVHLLDISSENIISAVTEIKDAGGEAVGHTVNLMDDSAISQFVSELSKTEEKVDVLFNNIGGPGPKQFEFTYADWEKAMRINLWSPTFLTQQLLHMLKKSGSASIIFTSSTAGLVASLNSPIYSAAKGAVIQYAKSLAVLLAPDGIRVNALCPGVTDTPMLPGFYGGTSMDEGDIRSRVNSYVSLVPMSRLAKPEEMATVVLFLASDQASFITGIALPVDGGLVAR